MSDNIPLERTQLEQWLSKSGIDHYLCDQCNGLHLSGLQELEGVVDSRLFIETWGLLLSTELVIRPVALLPIAADLGRLNMDYPTLKLFLDIVDDAMPQLVAGAIFGPGASTVPMDNPTHVCEPDASTFKLVVPMEALKDAE